MALEIPPNSGEIDQKARTDVQRELTGSNPFRRNHWLGAIITGFSNRIYDLYQQFLIGIDANFPDTTIGIYLQRWLRIFRINQNAASASAGSANATGTLGSIIAITDILSLDGITYTPQSSQTITNQVVNVSVIERSGTVATVTYLNAHGYSNNLTVTFSGANETEYNGAKTITVLNANQITFPVTGTPATPATGTINSSADFAKLSLVSSTTGENTNAIAGSQLAFQVPVAGVDSSATVDAGAIGGGNEAETNTAVRNRLLSRIQNPVAHFNEGDIQALALTLAGVTRVFVQTPSTSTTSVIVDLQSANFSTSGETLAVATIQSGTFPFFSGQPITVTNASELDFNVVDANCIITSVTTLAFSAGTTSQVVNNTQATITGSDVPLGTVKVYFMRDNDTNAIPDGSEVTALNNLLLTILPANTSANDLVVSAPAPVSVDVSISSLLPNTQTLRDSINESLRLMMIDRTNVGIDLSREIIISTIANTLDNETGVYPTDFSLTLPSADVTINAGEIPILGTVTFV